MNTQSPLNSRLSPVVVISPLEQRMRKLLASIANNKSQGFTLIELMVVILILGILVSISMPNFLKQAVKAKQTESKQSLTLVNRAQSRYRTEFNSFSSSFDQLAVGMNLVGNSTASTNNYIYTLDLLADPFNKATVTASPTDPAVRSYTAGNLRYNNAGQTSIAAIVCESITPGSASLTTVTFNSTSMDCPTGYRLLDDTATGN